MTEFATDNKPQSEISGTVQPTSDGTWLSKTTSNGTTSSYGGGVAGIDVSLSLTPVVNQVTQVTIDSIDIVFDYSK